MEHYPANCSPLEQILLILSQFRPGHSVIHSQGNVSLLLTNRVNFNIKYGCLILYCTPLMKAVNKADANFNNRIILDFHKNIKLLIVVNFLCVISILFFYTLFYYLLKLLGLNSSTDILFYIQAFDNLPSLNKYIFYVLILITAIIHELIHGLFCRVKI